MTEQILSLQDVDRFVSIAIIQTNNKLCPEHE